MKILVIGSGGREHALVWKLKQSPRVEEVWCSPGNAGIRQIAEVADLNVSNIAGLAELAKDIKAELTVVGPEVPLSQGIVDYFREEGLRIFGPTKKAGELEASKVFSKRLMKKYNIPTAAYEEFNDPQQALEYLKSACYPIVVKADGLAAGKGVIIARTQAEANAAVNTIMTEREFGAAGQRIVVEEFLEGQEVSMMAFAAGADFHLMPPAQDHKPIFDNDQGPNTGGMGCYSPVPIVTEAMQQEAADKVIAPTLQAMAAEGRPYYGVLYAGLIITKDGLKTLEFNCRFGDPETQVILPRLESDLVDILEPIAAGHLGDAPRWSNRAATCVVMAAGGYPGKYDKMKQISGLEEAAQLDDTIVFHAATFYVNRHYFTNGGRVLGVTGLGEDLKASVDHAYVAVNKITWENVQFRHDIAAKAMRG